MPRATNKVASHRKRVRFMKLSKGFWGRRKNVWTIAKNHIEKGLLTLTLVVSSKNAVSVVFGLFASMQLQD